VEPRNTPRGLYLVELRDLPANAIARELNARRIEIPHGNLWSAVTVSGCSAGRGWRHEPFASCQSLSVVIGPEHKAPYYCYSIIRESNA
jgi:hypothetical protein